MNNLSIYPEVNTNNAWDNLSLAEKAEMMKVAIKNGITNISDIKDKYNEFAGGGPMDDSDVVDWIIREEGFLDKPTNIGDGKMTLGSGLTKTKWHNLYKQRGNRWSKEDNRRAVAEEVAERRRWAEKNVPNWDSLPSSSQKALLSYKYNYDFNKNNSPKLFQALADSDYREAARQMDATSKSTSFRKGLQARRQREQKWFLQDINNTPTYYEPIINPAVSTQVYNPYVTRVESTQYLPTREPDPSSYIRTREVTPQEQRRRKFQENVEAYQRFNALMNLIDLRNNPAPSYVSSHPLFELVNGFAEGGDTGNKLPIGGPISIGTAVRGAVKAAKQRLYENLSPIGYDDLSRVPKAILLNEPDRYHDTMKDMPVLDEIYAQYLGIPEKDRHFNQRLEKSAYKPTIGGENVVYYKLPQTKVDGRTILGDNNRYNGFSNTAVDTMVFDATYMDPNTNKQQLNTELGYYTVGRGRDEKGDYVSYYDKWDINPFKGGLSNKSALPKDAKHVLSNISMDFGTPVHIYDRIYFDDYYGIKGDDMGGHYLPEVIVTGKKHSIGGPLVETAMNEFKDGGGIHIKPSHRGRLTELKKRTGKTEAELYRTGSPATRKMITFARNARKWKHGLGGNLFQDGGNSHTIEEPYFFSYGYPVYWSDEVPSKYNWAKSYLKEHPDDVTGFAVGGGSQGPEDIGPRVIIRNSHSSVIPDHNDGRWYFLDKIEAIRHYMSEIGYVPNFKTSPEQDKFRKDNFSKEDGYGYDDTAWKESIISRITANKKYDKKFGVTPEQYKDYAKIMRGLNSKRNNYMDNYYNIPNEHRGGYYLPEVTITGKKHRFGGNLFDGIFQPTQKMNISIPFYEQYSPINYTEDIVKYRKERDAKDKALIQRLSARGKEIADKRTKEYFTTSNDATASKEGRTQNTHLKEKVSKGAKAHAIWEEEHPVATQWGNMLGAVPFAIAAYPLAATAGSGVVALGDAAATTSIGQGITNFLSPIATTSIAGTTVPQWLDLGVTSNFGAHGLQTAIDEGGISPMTALEISPTFQVARPLKEMSGKTLTNLATSEKGKWYARAAYDGLFNPFGTINAIVDGRYIHDINSLYRNVKGARKEIYNGIKSTNNQYLDLTGFQIPETPVVIEPWKNLKRDAVGYYSGLTKDIHIPVTQERYSNIMNIKNLRGIAGHEQAHAASHYLATLTGNPRLREYSPITKYFIPNSAHPIAAKYANDFMKAWSKHGKSPEETWANYMGAKAIGMPDWKYKIDNWLTEGIYPKKGFIEDYKQYLRNTYKPISFFYNP